MRKPERAHFMSDVAYTESLKRYANYLEATIKPRQVIKTINGPIDIWEAMERHCQAYQIKKGHFIFEAIKEKLQNHEK